MVATAESAEHTESTAWTENADSGPGQFFGVSRLMHAQW